MNCTKNTVYDYQPAKSISESMLEVFTGRGRHRSGLSVHGAQVNDKNINYTKAESNQRTQPAHSCKQSTITTTPFSCIITIPFNNI